MTRVLRQFGFLAFAVLLLIISNKSTAQTSPSSEADLKKEAEKYFDQEDFPKAYPLYSQLLSLYPDDPNYNYRFGTCMLFSKADKEKPVNYLELAIKKPGTDKLAYYYLGRAYHLNYRFDDAIKTYQQFQQVASSTELKKHPVDHLIQMCNDGKTLLKDVHDLDVLEKKELSLSDYFHAYDLNANGGTTLVEPDDFKSKLDKKKQLNSVIYLSPDRNDVFYASYGENEENGKDIYEVKRLPTGGFSKPTNLGTIINTPYDEDYPFYDAPTHTLYFSSKGHNSMGGYDVFKSVYNEGLGIWSTPVNMDFPVNTPDDDILFIADTLGQTAFFASSRSSPEGTIDIYKIKIQLHAPENVLLKGIAYSDNGKTPTAATITVKNYETGKTVGVFNSSHSDGGYFMNLPNGTQLVYSVESPGHATQSVPVMIPKEEELVTLTQEMGYDSATERLIITNHFESAGINADYLLALDYIKKKALMEVNVDTTVPLANNNTANNQSVQNLNPPNNNSSLTFPSNSSSQQNSNNVTQANNASNSSNSSNNITSTQNNNTSSANNTNVTQNNNPSTINNSSNNNTSSSQNNNSSVANNTSSQNNNASTANNQQNNSSNSSTIANNNNSSQNNNVNSVPNANHDSLNNPNLTNDQLVKVATNDAQQDEQAALTAKENAIKATEYANDKLQEAQNLNNQAQVISDNAANIVDAKQRNDSLAKAALLRKQADESSKKATEAYQIAAQEQTDATAKQKQADIEKQYSVSLDSATKIKDNKQAIAHLQKQEDSLKKQQLANHVASVSAGDLIRQQAQDTKQDSVQVAKHADELKQEVNGLEQQSQDYINQAQKTDNAQEKLALLQQAKDLSESKKHKQSEIEDNQKLEQQLHQQYVSQINEAQTADNSARNNSQEGSPQVSSSDAAIIKQEIEHYNPSASNNSIAAAQTNRTSPNQNNSNSNNQSVNNTQANNSNPDNTSSSSIANSNNPNTGNNNNQSSQQVNNNNLTANQQNSANASTNQNSSTQNNAQTANSNSSNSSSQVATNQNANNSQSANNSNTNNTSQQANNNAQQLGNPNNSASTSNTQSATQFNTTSGVNKVVSTTSVQYFSPTATAASKAAVADSTEASTLTTEANDTRQQARQANDPAQARLLSQKADSLDNLAQQKSLQSDEASNTASSSQFLSNKQQIVAWQNALKNNNSDKITTARLQAQDANVYYNKSLIEKQKADSTNKPYLKESYLQNAGKYLKTALLNQQSAENIYLSVDPKLASVAPSVSTTASSDNNIQQSNAIDNNATQVALNNAQNNSSNSQNSNLNNPNQANSSALVNNVANNNPSNTSANSSNTNTANNQTSQNSSSNNANVSNNSNSANTSQIAQNNTSNANSANNVNSVTNSQIAQNNSNNNSQTNATNSSNNAQNNTASNVNSATNSQIAQNNSNNNSQANPTNSSNITQNNSANNTNNSSNQSAKRIDSILSASNSSANQNTVNNNNSSANNNTSAQNTAANSSNANLNTNNALNANAAQNNSNNSNTNNSSPANNNQLNAANSNNSASNNSIPNNSNQTNSNQIAQNNSTPNSTNTSSNNQSNSNNSNSTNNNSAQNNATQSASKIDSILSANSSSNNNNATNTQQASSNPNQNSTSSSSNANSANNNSTQNTSSNANNSRTISITEDIFVESATSPYSENKPIPINPTLPEGLVYKVQIGAFRNSIPQNLFKGIQPITGEKTATGLTRYLAGIFKEYPGAKTAQTKIRELGYKDAFVVAFYNGKRISLSQAQALQAGNAPAIAASNVEPQNNNTPANNNNSAQVANNNPVTQQQQTNNSNNSASVPVTDVKGLFFSVQVGAYQRPIPPSQLYNLSPLFSYNAPNGYIRYNCGIYSNLPKARIAKEEIILKTPIKDAFIVAYSNGERIGIAQAGQLLSSGGATVPQNSNLDVMPNGTPANNGNPIQTPQNNTPTNNPPVNPTPTVNPVPEVNNSSTQVAQKDTVKPESSPVNPTPPANSIPTTNNAATQPLLADTSKPSTNPNPINTPPVNPSANNSSSSFSIVSRTLSSPSIEPAGDIDVSITIHRGAISGFAKLKEIIPSGFTASEGEKQSATCKFEDGTLSYVWMTLPSDSIFTITYKLTALSTASGQQTLTGKFLYIANNEKEEASIAPSIITVGGSGSSVNPALNATNTVSTTAPTSSDTTAKKVSFCVQVGSYSGPIPIDMANKLLKISNQGIKAHKEDNGITSYTVGDYPDFTSADLLNQELKKDGYTQTFVVAYSNGKKISLEDAQLLMHK